MTALLAPALFFGCLAAALGHAWLILWMRPLHSVRDTLVFSLYLAAAGVAAFVALHLVLGALAKALRWSPERSRHLRTGASIFVLAAPLFAATYIVATRPFYIRHIGDLAGFVAMIAVAAGAAWLGRRGGGRTFASWGRSLAGSAAASFLPLAAYAVTAESRSTPEPAAIAPAPRPGRHVFLVGFDGATWDVMAPLLEQGRLPNFQRVMEQGVSGTLWSEIAPNQPFQNSASRGMRTPVIWETIATGRSPRDHGVWDFFVTRLPGLERPFPMRLPQLRFRANAAGDGLEPRIWEIGERAELGSLVVGWVDTWPAFGHDHCRMISDRAHYQDRQQTWPLELAEHYAALFREYPEYAARLGDRLDPRFLALAGDDPAEFERNRELLKQIELQKDALKMPRYQEIARDWMGVVLDPGYADLPAQDPRRLEGQLILSQAREMDKDLFYLDAARRMLASARDQGGLPPLSAIYFSQTDTGQHLFWQFHEPQAFPQVDPGLVQRLGGVVPRMYENADRMLGQLLEHADDETTVVIVSDHGAGAWSELQGGFDPFVSGEAHLGYSGNHRDNGVYLAMGPGLLRGHRADLDIYQIAPLVLHALGLPVAENMPAGVPEELLEPDYRRQYPARSVPDYGRRALPAGASRVENVSDEEYLRRQQEMGYVGGEDE
ncbi:MAG: hypothetical protein EYC70_05870 [Planctomycetota bacterium]|nr:MAG: hypothetical protein EYC70_05870 [Planctomycetota bacterium]